MKIIPMKIQLNLNPFIYFSSSVIYRKHKYLLSKLKKNLKKSMMTNSTDSSPTGPGLSHTYWTPVLQVNRAPTL